MCIRDSVYPGRAKHDRDGVHSGCQGLVLDQLDQVIAEHDSALAYGHVLTDREGPFLHLRGPTGVGGQIVQPVAGAEGEALTPGIESTPHSLGVGEEVVGGSGGIDHEVGDELGL